jgi:hypothetical protein
VDSSLPSPAARFNAEKIADNLELLRVDKPLFNPYTTAP